MPRRWFVAALSLLLVWLIGREAVVGTVIDTRPALARAIAPGDPRALIAASDYRARAPYPPTPAQLALLDRAARADPLYPEPYLAHAALVAGGGDHTRAERLGQAAVARESRWLAAHTLLLSEYARTGDLARAVGEMAPLAALSGETGPALAKALDAAAQDPRGAKVVAAALGENPVWRSYFIREAGGNARSLAFQSLVAAPKGVSDADNRQDRAAFLNQLVGSGDYQRAYLAWINFLPASQTGSVAAIYDGDFQGLPGLEPFNWTLAGNEAATGERRADSTLPGRHALDVNFFGTGPATIASQTLLVPPGDYQFTLLGSADGGGNFAGTLRWQLTCLPSRAVTTLATLNQFTGKPFAVRQPVTIPAQGCAAQQLTLSGEPGEVQMSIHAQFTGLKLVAR